MAQKAHSLAAVDQLNIIFFGEMDISTAEKRLRVVMAAALQRILLKYYDTIQRSLAVTPFTPDSAALYAAAAAGFAREYMSFFNNYYPRYLEALGSGSPESAESWVRRHSQELSLWILNTSIGDSIAPIYDRLMNTVRTEVNEIGNLAVNNAALNSGKTRKRWRTFGDSRVRNTHRAASGQTVPINEPFIIGGSRLMFPCDTSLGADASEVVNCRCTVQYL